MDRVDRVVSWCKKKAKSFKHEQQPATRASNARAMVIPPTTTDGETAASHATAATPSKKAYAFEATKQTLDVLSGIVGLVGIPLVKEVIEIGISIVSTCENINKVQGKVEELKNRVTGFLMIIAKVATDLEKTSQDLMKDLEEFKQPLLLIKENLQAIEKQNVVLKTLLPKANMDAIDTCANLCQNAIDRFLINRGIHVAQDLNQIQNQLQALYTQTTVISHKVEGIDARTIVMSQKVDDLRALLERTQGTDLAITSIEMPPLPDVFVGREVVVDRIAGQLASCQAEKSRVCVLGPGGIGKSSVASAVMEHPAIKETFPSKNRLWIPCVSLRSPTAFLAHLTRQLGMPAQADPLEAIILVLQNDGPYLFHLDNFETPWHPIEGGQAATKKIIQALNGVANVSILITMRSALPPLPHWKTERLEILSLDDCCRIYTTITGSETSTELDTLLESIGRLPYAVMLLAKQAQCSELPPSELLQRWKMDGPRLLSDVEDTTSGMEASIELSIRSPYVTKCSGALQLLQTLSLLPAGVYRDDLSIWMKSWEVPALSVLRNACLVMTREVVTDGQKKMHLYVLPVVQSYFRQEDRIPTSIWVSTYNACFEFLLRRKCVLDGPNTPGFGPSRQAINKQEVNIQALLTEVVEALDPSDTVHIPTGHSRLPPALLLPTTAHIEALLTFVSYQVHTKPRLDFAGRVHSIVCSYSKESVYVAFSTYHLAETNRWLENRSPAVELYQQAKDLFLHFNRPIEACNAEFIALECYREVCGANPSSSLSLPQAVADAGIRWKDFTDHTISALVSYWTGRLHFLRPPYGMEYSEILSTLLQAKTLLISQHRPADALECLAPITSILLNTKQLEEARASIEEAIELAKVHGLQLKGGLHNRLAKNLKALNCWGPELTIAIVESVTLARKAGLPYPVALALVELGEVYVREENWAAARLAYEEALKECRKEHGYSIEQVAKRVQDNLTYVAAKEVDLGDDSLSFIPPPRF